jgi:hypothetical protein
MNPNYKEDLGNLKKIEKPNDIRMISFLKSVFDEFISNPYKIREFLQPRGTHDKFNTVIPIPQSVILQDEDCFVKIREILGSNENNWIYSYKLSKNKIFSYFFDIYVLFWYLEIFNIKIYSNKELLKFFKKILNSPREYFSKGGYLILKKTFDEIFKQKSDEELIIFIGMMNYSGYFDIIGNTPLTVIYDSLKNNKKDHIVIGQSTVKIRDFVDTYDINQFHTSKIITNFVPYEKINHNSNNINVKGYVTRVADNIDGEASQFLIDLEQNGIRISILCNLNYIKIMKPKVKQLIISSSLEFQYYNAFRETVLNTTKNSVLIPIIEEKNNGRNLTLIMGKNNSGKTYELIQIKNDFQNNFSSICFFLPNKRFLGNSTGNVESFEELLYIFLKSLHTLCIENSTLEEKWKIENFIQILQLCNIEEDHCPNRFKPILISFRLIFKLWKSIINDFFDDIEIGNIEIKNRKSMFLEIKDDFSPESKKKFFDDWFKLGSGIQELLSLVFIIEYIKYGPQFLVDLKWKDKNSPKWNNFLENPDNYLIWTHQNKILLIDEPEISMHPSLLKKFVKYLSESSEKIKIFVATNSIQFLSASVEKSIVLCQREINGEYKKIKITPNNYFQIIEELYEPDSLELSLIMAEEEYKLIMDSQFQGTQLLVKKIRDEYNSKYKPQEFFNLGTQAESWKLRVIQNSLFLSSPIKNINLNCANFSNRHDLEKVHIVQIVNFSDIIRTKCLNGETNALAELCKLWNHEEPDADFLIYGKEEKKIISKKILNYLRKLKKEEIKEGQSLVIFAENLAPYSILKNLIDFASNNNIILVCGMEHVKYFDFKNIINSLPSNLKKRYIDLKLERIFDHISLQNDTLLNLALIVNGNQLFSFQIKNNPVYLFQYNKKEKIDHLLEPTIFIFHCMIGRLSIFVCKDFLANHSVIPYWMYKYSVDSVIIPSITHRVRPFLNKLWEIVERKQFHNLNFMFANLAEYGGSGIINYKNRNWDEPNNVIKLKRHQEGILSFEFQKETNEWELYQITN